MTAYDPAALKVLLSRHEGVKPSMYRDTLGNQTVGIGHNMDIPQSTFVVDALYGCDVVGCEKSLDANVPWWRDLDPVRQLAMLDLMFNMGWGNGKKGLSSFRNTLAAFEQGKFGAAAAGLTNSLWAKQVQGGRSSDLAGIVSTGKLPAWMEAVA